MTQESPSRDQDKFMVRMPEGMRDRLSAAAKENNRSMNAEIVARLSDSFPTEQPQTAALRALMDEQLRLLHQKRTAHSALAALGKLKAPTSAEAIADLIEKESLESAAYAVEEQRIIKLFAEAEEVLRQRLKSLKKMKTKNPP